MPRDALPLVESFDLIALMAGPNDRVTNAMGFVEIDTRSSKVRVQTTNGTPQLFAYLAFLGGWRDVQVLQGLGLRVPPRVAERFAMLNAVADHFAEQMAHESSIS